MATFKLAPLVESQAREILAWRYPDPYDFYNPPDDDHTEHYVREFLNATYQFHGIQDAGGDFVGFCSFGIDGQVPGGNYSFDALDIGLGMKPELTGNGLGSEFFDAILKFAADNLRPEWFRLTVADFNRRAMKLYRKAGFAYHDSFVDPMQHVAYSILVRRAHAHTI
jgi:[ribosomal protein S18]-alanine N-acetyltransferase